MSKEDLKQEVEDFYKRYPEASPNYKPGMYKKHIPKGSRWVHTNGNRYTVLFLTNTESTDHLRYPPMVVYRGENGNVWTRKAADWDRSMKRDRSWRLHLPLFLSILLSL